MRRLILATVITSLILGSGISQPTYAKRLNKSIAIPGGGVCQPSTPSNNGNVLARPNGFRNEGATAIFAICGFPLPANVDVFVIYFWSIDGIDRNINCTATDGTPIYGQQFSSKSVMTSGGQGYLSWNDSDFGGRPTEPMHNYHSITCNLPSQMSVIYLDVGYRDEVGS